MMNQQNLVFQQMLLSQLQKAASASPPPQTQTLPSPVKTPKVEGLNIDQILREEKEVGPSKKEETPLDLSRKSVSWKHKKNCEPNRAEPSRFFICELIFQKLQVSWKNSDQAEQTYIGSARYSLAGMARLGTAR